MVAMKTMKAMKAMKEMKAMKAMKAPMKAMKAMKAPMKAMKAPKAYTVEFPKKVYKVPGDIPKKYAKRVKMIEINTKGFDKIYYPLTEAEAANWVAPPIFSQSLNMRIKTCWDNTGSVVWNVSKEFADKAFGGN